jgi:tetratricopeptide (TPR) repeat protein
VPGRFILVVFLAVGLSVAQDKASEQTLARALQLHQAGHYTEAIAAYETYLKAHPEAAGVRSNLGAALAHEGQFKEAIHEYTLALQGLPTNHRIQFNLGLAYYKSGDIPEATKTFEAVYNVLPLDDPQRRNVATLLGECYLRQGDDQRVIGLLDPMADADPNDLAVDYLLGTALLHEGHEQRGALMIQRILRNGDSAEAHMLMAVTKMKANDHTGTMQELDRAIQLNPKLPEAYSLRGRMAFIDSNLTLAESSFRSALAIDPNSFDALLMLGALLREQGRTEEARPLLEHALKLRPKEMRARYQYAVLLSSEGDDKKAAELLEALVKDVPGYTEAHRSLASIYFRLGRQADGRREREIAEKLDEQIQTRDTDIGRTLK